MSRLEKYAHGSAAACGRRKSFLLNGFGLHYPFPKLVAAVRRDRSLDGIAVLRIEYRGGTAGPLQCPLDLIFRDLLAGLLGKKGGGSNRAALAVGLRDNVVC